MQRERSALRRPETPPPGRDRAGIIGRGWRCRHDSIHAASHSGESRNSDDALLHSDGDRKRSEANRRCLSRELCEGAVRSLARRESPSRHKECRRLQLHRDCVAARSAHRTADRDERGRQSPQRRQRPGDSMLQHHVRIRGNSRAALKNSFRKIEGSICAPRGFKAAAVFCDIKRIGTGKGSEKDQKRDLALIVSDIPAAVAGVFTTNQVCAAPVKVSAKHAAGKRARAIVVNSGNANACTGRRGMADAKLMTQITAKSLGISAREVLVCSTGRIGVPMPMTNVKRGISAASQQLTRSGAAARAAAEAIMTSDTRRKEIAVEFELAGVPVRIGGICKGAGMIQPQMAPHATMLGFITTDASVESRQLKTALKEAVAQSFNRITVDGDMSTNDSVLILANGLAGNESFDVKIFQHALNFVTLELAKMIVRDGEGVTRFVTLRVQGGQTPEDAEAVARAVANSTL